MAFSISAVLAFIAVLCAAMINEKGYRRPRFEE